MKRTLPFSLLSLVNAVACSHSFRPSGDRRLDHDHGWMCVSCGIREKSTGYFTAVLIVHAHARKNGWPS